MITMECGCHCIKCGSIEISSKQIRKTESDGYFDMHHTCKSCGTHFDHLEGNTFDTCKICSFNSN